MKTTVTLAFLLLPTLCCHAASSAFVNVNVVPMTSDTVIRAQTVIVEDGRISRVGPVGQTAVPEGARVVDGTDRYLVPGLAEMHAHVPPLSSENLDRVLTLYLVNGVTTVRGMLGEPGHLELREALATGRVLGPRLYTSGPSFNGRSVESSEQASDMVRRQHDAGYDFLKIHPGLTRAEFNAIAETSAALQIPFAGHVPEDVGVEAALAAGIASIDHLDGYMQLLVPANVDPSGGVGGFFGVLLGGAALAERIVPVAEATADTSTWNVPTQSLFEHVTSAVPPDEMADWPEMKYMPAATVRQWQESKQDITGEPGFDASDAERAIELRRKLIKALHDADAGLLLGSDSPQIFNVPGFAIHRELRYLVDSGLSPYEALRTGTVNAARYFGQAGEFGAVESGQAADLMLLDDNPLEDIGATRRIHGVMRRGVWLSRQDIEERLRSLER